MYSEALQPVPMMLSEAWQPGSLGLHARLLVTHASWHSVSFWGSWFLGPAFLLCPSMLSSQSLTCCVNSHFFAPSHPGFFHQHLASLRQGCSISQASRIFVSHRTPNEDSSAHALSLCFLLALVSLALLAKHLQDRRPLALLVFCQ